MSPNAKRHAAGGMVKRVDRQTVTVEEAAQALGISRAQAYALIARDAFPVPVIRLGRRVVVPLKPLQRLLDGEGGTAA